MTQTSSSRKSLGISRKILRVATATTLAVYTWSFALAGTAIAATHKEPDRWHGKKGLTSVQIAKKIADEAAKRKPQLPLFPYHQAAENTKHRHIKMVATKPLTLLDEVGRLAHPVADREVMAWETSLKEGTATGALAGRLHLWLGEWELAKNQQPEQAIWHFDQAKKLSDKSQAIYGLASYDSATALFYEGAYVASARAFSKLENTKTVLPGYDVRRAALWLRHAVACAGYHEDHAKKGIPEPPRLDPLCGAAGLAAMLRSMGRPWDQNVVLAAIRHTGEGSSFQDIIDAAQKLDLTAIPVSANDSGLMSLPKPAIAYVEHDHFITVTHANKSGVSYLCSDCGPWPGGQVNLTWAQWHKLDSTVYLEVFKPHSVNESVLRKLVGITSADNPDLLSDMNSAERQYYGNSIIQSAVQNRRVWKSNDLLRTAELSSAEPFAPKMQYISGQANSIPLSRPRVILQHQVTNISCGSSPAAQDCKQCAVCCPEDGSGTENGGGPPTESARFSGASAGDPVNLATGEEDYSPEPDLLVYNPNGPAVGWQRIYSSLRGVGDGYPSIGNTTYQCADFGVGWSQNYNICIYDPTIGGTGSTNLKYIIESNGGRISFTAPSAPTASNPSVPCTVEPGVPVLINWIYDGSSLGHYLIIHNDRTEWVTTGPNQANCYQLAQLIDRNGNSIYFNYATGYQSNWHLLNSISTGSGATGTILLSIQRAADGSGNITQITDCYGRSVYYHVDTYRTWHVSPSYPQTYQELDHVSQVVASCTVNPPDRYAYGYKLTSNLDGVEQVSSLHTITVPSPTGIGSATATINYDQSTAFVSSIVDGDGNARSYQGISNTGTPSAPSNAVKVTVTDASSHVAYAYQSGFDNNMSVTFVTNGAGVVKKGDIYSDPNNPFRPSSETDGNGNQTSYTWDQYGNLLQKISPRGVVTTYTYDYTHFALGELTSIQEGSKTPTQVTYVEPSGHVSSINGPLPGSVGQPLPTIPTLSYQYDSLGNITTMTSRGSSVSQAIVTTYNFTSDPGDPTHGIAAYSQSAHVDEPLTATDNLGHTTHYRYDTRGNKITEIDPLGNETDYLYNIANDNVSILNPASGQTGPGQSSIVLTFEYPGGPNTTSYIYDESGNLIRQYTRTYGSEGELLSKSGSGHSTAFTYDAQYRQIAVNDANSNVTHYAFDAAGHLISRTYPDGHSYQFTSFDNAGDVLTRIDPNGVETDYSYSDPESLPTKAHYPSDPSQDISISYDSYGRMASRGNSIGTDAITYDDDNNKLSVQTTYNLGGTSTLQATISYQLNANGTLHSLSTPAGTYSYTYDLGGRASNVTDPSGNQTGWGYYDNNWLKSKTISGVSQTQFTRNSLGNATEVESTKISDGSVLSDFDMSFDSAEHITNVVSNIPAVPSYSGSTTYTYSSLNELTSEQSTSLGTYLNSYAPDAVGNLTSIRSVSHTFNGNNQDSANTYDANGNPTVYMGTSCAYDYGNHLTQVGTTMSAGYRSDGLRAWKQTSAGRIYYIYDDAHLVCEMTGAGSIISSECYGEDGLISRTTPTGTIFYTYDPAGNVCQRLDSSGNIIGSQKFDAFGDRVCTDANVDPFCGFNGQAGGYTDFETGLTLFGNRYYDSATGRFLTRDPSGFHGGVDLYEYCFDSPVTQHDPLGLGNCLNPFSWWGGAAGGCLGNWVADGFEKSYGGSVCSDNYANCLANAKCVANIGSAVIGIAVCAYTGENTIVANCVAGGVSGLAHALTDYLCFHEFCQNTPFNFGCALLDGFLDFAIHCLCQSDDDESEEKEVVIEIVKDFAVQLGLNITEFQCEKHSHG